MALLSIDLAKKCESLNYKKVGTTLVGDTRTQGSFLSLLKEFDL